MLNSMTGFGRAEQSNGPFACKAEIRSVNNRFIEINTRLPKFLAALELPIKKLIKSRCSRGSFDLFLTLEKSDESGAEMEIRPNLPLAKQYHEAFRRIQKQLDLPGELSLEALMGMKDVVKAEPPTLDASQEEMILKTVDAALSTLIEMRQEEGKHLQKDLSGQLQSIHQLTENIRERQPVVLEEYRTRLKEKVKTLTEGLDLDETRLAQESALMADKSDISEEITRLNSHLSQFRELFNKSEPIGRKLEFITQEINRETNTIGSKSVDYQISQNVIEIKSLLEKVREQLQNIE